MATQLASILRHIHQLAGPAGGSEFSDAELLRRFVDNRDEWAFRVLVGRHGRMVLNVCRQVLRQAQDAEDAFQATFLVLAQRAGSIREGAALASWLYNIAHRIALRARLQASRRRLHEKQAGERMRSRGDLDAALRELQAVLAEEVNRLPEKYRAPFVLCCLEGKSRSEAVAQLGWKDGTLSGRLAEARRRLQHRLERRGLTLAAALCAGAVSGGAAGAVPPVILRATIKAALGTAPAPVAALAEGVCRTLVFGKVKWVSVLLLAAGLVAAGAGTHIHRAFATPAGGDPTSAPAAQAADKTPAAKKDDKVVVNGRVLDPDGKPLAGAHVVLPAAVWVDSKKGSLVEVTSGEDGRFRFTIDRTQLVPGRSLAATAKGYALDWIEAEKLGRGEVTLRLVEDMPIRGRVLDLEGRPVKGVRVSVRRIAASTEGDLTPVLKSIQREGRTAFRHSLRQFYVGAESPLAAPVTTDDAGRFRFTGLGKERLAVLRVEGPTIEHQVLYVLTRPGLNVKELVQAAHKLMRITGHKTPLPAMYGPTFDHTAGPTQPIIGVVRDKATGKPVADATVNGNADGWWENYVQTKTDKEGRYRLIGLPKGRSYRLSASALPQDYLQAGKSIGDSPGLGSVTLDFELVHGVRVKGRITDKQTGKPVHAALQYVMLADNKFFGKIPGNPDGGWNQKDGSYSLLVPPGSGLLMVRADVGGENPYMEAAIHPADRTKTYKYEGLSEGFVAAGGGMFELVGQNAYRLIDPAPDAKAITCDIPLERGRTRTGKVVDPDGKPLTNVRVRGLAAPAARDGSKPLADSSFKAIALNPLRPRLIAFVHPGRKLVGHIFLKADAKEPVTVRLRPGAVLTGRLLDEDGKPLAGVTVSCSSYFDDRDGTWWPADEAFAARAVQTDAGGRFRVEGIFPGLKFGLGFGKDKRSFVTEGKHRSMTLEAGTKDLGDITAKPYRPQ